MSLWHFPAAHMSLDPGQSGEVATGPGAKGLEWGWGGATGCLGRGFECRGWETHTHRPRKGPALSSRGRHHLSRMSSRPRGSGAAHSLPGQLLVLRKPPFNDRARGLGVGTPKWPRASCPVWASGSSSTKRSGGRHAGGRGAGSPPAPLGGSSRARGPRAQGCCLPGGGRLTERAPSWRGPPCLPRVPFPRSFSCLPVATRTLGRHCVKGWGQLPMKQTCGGGG